MSSALAELIGEAHAFEDLDRFREGIPTLLRRFVPADRASYNEMDDDPSGSWWTVDPELRVSPGLEQTFAELAGENPVLNHMRRTRDSRPYRISDFLSRDEYRRLPLYTEFYPEESGLSVAALEALGLTPRQAEALRWIALGCRGPARRRPRPAPAAPASPRSRGRGRRSGPPRGGSRS